MKRRDFLKFVGMASSATVLSSCGVEKSTEKIIPLLNPITDPDYLPGESMWRHSTCTECAAGCGTTVRLVDFNAVKLEGREGHPHNDGALCMRGQASLMRLYHPERFQTPLRRNEAGELEAISWAEAFQMVLQAMKQAGNKKNVYLGGRVTGSLSAMVDEFCQATAVERLKGYDVDDQANIRAANMDLFGRAEVPAYNIDRADFLLTVGADIFETFQGPVANARQVQKARKDHHLKWTHVEPHASLTGFKADHRLTVQPGGEAALLSYLLGERINSGGPAGNSISANIRSQLTLMNKNQAAQKTGIPAEKLEELSDAFSRANNPLLIVGGVSTAQPGGKDIAKMAGLIQWAAGMTNNTVDFTHAVNMGGVGTLNDLKAFSDRLNGGQIGVAIVSGCDPVGTAPASIGLAESFGKAGLKVALAQLGNATVDQCDLILPLSDSMESWGDVEAQRGLTGILKPVLQESIYDTKSEGDILLTLSKLAQGQRSRQSYESWVKARWNARFGADNVPAIIEAGYQASAPAAVQVSLNNNIGTIAAAAVPATSGGVLYAVQSIRNGDGRSKALPLSLEVPDPLTTVTYGDWISMSKASAEAMGIKKPDELDDHGEKKRQDSLTTKHRHVLNFGSNGATMELPNVVQLGMPENVYTVHRDQLNTAMLAYDAATGACYSRIDDINPTNTGERKALAIMAGEVTQDHRNMTRKLHTHAHEHFDMTESLYDDPYDRYETYRWAMAVDMDTCTGCSACVTACFIENNIPTVGEDENLKGREMSWIRVQPYYFEESDGSVTMDSLVMMCQQCDYAPCENVCPVYATYHNEEGLNVMVYNRCVGTRYCHNNCPYKVRRFNWFDWTDKGVWDGAMSRMLNPDVWVRPKGVMEKCTFCVQRIRIAKDTAKDEGRNVRDGEVIPACAQTCPTNAITFGNKLDKNSKVYNKSKEDGHFEALEFLRVGPAIAYISHHHAGQEDH